MVVDPDRIRLFEVDCERPSSDSLSFPAAEVFEHYTSHYEEFQGFRLTPKERADFMATLVAVWIDDLMFRWKPGDPPRKQEFVEAGLLPRIERGNKFERRMLCDDPLHRDQLSRWHFHRA